MSELDDLGLEDSPFSDFLGFELLLEERGPRAARAACARS